MNSLSRALIGLWGAWRLIQFDKRGLTAYDASAQGFIHSFWALAIALPIYFIAMSLQNVVLLRENNTSFPILLTLIDYMARWAGFLVFSYAFGRILGLAHNFMGFATVYNWAKPLLIALPLPILIFGASGLLTGQAYGLFSIALLFYLSAVQVFLLHTALGATWWESIGIFIAVAIFDMIVKKGLEQLF